MDCLFCKIMNGEIPAKTLYEDSKVKVIMDIKPTSNGHCLIIPKEHTRDFETIAADDLIYIYKIASLMKDYLYKSLLPKGLALTLHHGVNEVDHFHLHLIPIYQEEQTIEDLDLIYQQIKRVII